MWKREKERKKSLFLFLASAGVDVDGGLLDAFFGFYCFRMQLW